MHSTARNGGENSDKSSEERAEMGRAGRKRMLEIFDKKMVVKETLGGLVISM